ncbi:MAG: IclR family transcriptional regulator [Candidatus Caldatribacteriota bacterium]|nr:IclR family transcriptional regulator [Candidatus Caldatribacteriota bacterium]
MENIKSNKGKLKSINKALDLLEFLSLSEQEVCITEINKKLRIGLSTVHRILTTLKSRGYVIQNLNTRKYRLGIKLFELGCVVQNTAQLVEIAKPYLRQLSKITNETANIAVLEDKEVIYLDTINSPEVLRTEIIAGTRTPAHCTALGKVMLAFISDWEFESLYKSDEPLSTLTSKSISSLEELKKSLKKVKKQGYAVDMEEYKIGINCIGVPIFGKNGVMAAISITGPASRFTIDEMEKVKGKLIIISKEISSQL